MVDYSQANYIFNNNGVVVPDTSDIQETIQGEYQEALGSDLSLEESTPQGRLIDIETTARINTIGYNSTVANVLINIYQSSGQALDAWGANFGIYRYSATSSQVTATVTGVINTVITKGSQAQDVNGILWDAENDIIIGITGTATGTFICSQTGKIELGIGELDKIVASGTLGIDGWETITNNAVAVLGSNIESDNSFRERIINGIFGGSALFGNYKSAIMKVPNVTAAYTYDNPEGTNKILDTITIPPHSVYNCVQGGNSYDVAKALYEIKSAGCGWCGNTNIVVTDETYDTQNTVIYQIPTEVNFKVSANITSNNNSSSSLSDDVTNIIVSYFAGEIDNYAKPGIRGTVDPFILATVIQSQINDITINELKVGLVTATNHAIPSIIKASVTNGITWASINTSTFATAISSTNGNYIFTYDGTNWKLNSNTVVLSNYGITATGTPITNDKISVLFSNGSFSTNPIQVYASEIPTISTSNITVTING